MNKEIKFGAVASMVLIWIFGLQSCASMDPPAPSARGIYESVIVSKDMVTIENLLRWPLEGQAGVVKAGVELRRTFPDFRPLPPADLQRDGPMQLADGYILSFVWIGVPSGSLNIGLESEPCFSPERAAEISRAVLSPVFQDAHGVNRGRNYDAKGNGVRINFTTTPEAYRCVTSINVHSIRRTER